jgi:hypothetical protein
MKSGIKPMQPHKYLYIILFYAVFSLHRCFAQEALLVDSIGNFTNAAAFSYTVNGMLYVIDARSSEVIKIDTLGNQLKTAGGFGWKSGVFDLPCDIFATPLNIYVADKNNHRIQQFDKDLNYISELNGKNNATLKEEFKYPIACANLPSGDLFILDSENKRVIKYDALHNYNTAFGDFNWGRYSLNTPQKIRLYDEDEVAVLDGQNLVLFDFYGNGLNIIALPDSIIDFTFKNKILFITTPGGVYSRVSPESPFKRIQMPLLPEAIISLEVNNSTLYLLTSSKIYILRMYL